MRQPSVFISYSHNDKAWVKEYLLFNLEKHGIPCHIDYRDFEIGTASLIVNGELRIENRLSLNTPKALNPKAEGSA